MSETARIMLVRGVAAAHAGDYAEARSYLERALHNDATHSQAIEAHLWLSRITSDAQDQRAHLEDVLAADPLNAEARRALAILDGRLDPEDIIDPDRASQPKDGAEQAESPPAAARRLICPMCAGRVRFEPGKAVVQCKYCGHSQSLVAALQHPRSLAESDFIVALATAKGHTLPEGQRLYRCQGCGASLLAAGAISTHCPYCGSAHIVAHEAPATVPPEGIIPFAVTHTVAQENVRDWLDRRLTRKAGQLRTTRPRGIYLPMWTFDLMGEVGWQRSDDEEAGGGVVGLSTGIGDRIQALRDRRSRADEAPMASHYVMLDDVPVPATHSVPYALRELFGSFDLTLAVPYDPAYLSDWPAELYAIRVADASLVARRQALERARRDLRRQSASGGPGQNVHVFSRNLAIQSYKLLLVPVWLANYRLADTTYTVVINGQNGRTFGEAPPRGLGGLIRDWLSS